MDLFELFIAGGPVMGLMLLGSLATAAIMIDRFLFYRHADKGMNRFIEKLPSLMENASWQEMHVAVSQEENVAAYAAGEGIRAMMEGKDAELSLEVAYQTVAALLRARLNYLSMLVTLSPLLGLLGTIGGMISSFQIFNLQDGAPLAITGGIGEALIATATGLCVAIFALVVHTYFAQRLDDILTAVERAEALVSAEVRKRGC